MGHLKSISSKCVLICISIDVAYNEEKIKTILSEE